MNQRKKLEVMWLNIKVCKKRRGERFEGKVKKIHPKSTQYLPLYSSIIQDKFQSAREYISYANVWYWSSFLQFLVLIFQKPLTREETLLLQKIIYPLLKKSNWTFKLTGRKQKWVCIFCLIPLFFSTVGFKIIGISNFQKFMFALICSFCNKGRLTMKARWKLTKTQKMWKFQHYFAHQTIETDQVVVNEKKKLLSAIIFFLKGIERYI